MSRKKTNKIEAETGEVVQSNRPFIIRNGGIAKPLGQGLYLLGGKTHEQGGIDIDFTGDARIFSAQPILNGNSPAELVARGANPNITFNRQERFKDVNGINDDGSRKKAENGKEVKVVPTREEYITTKIDSTINSALNKSRTRKYPSSPLILDGGNKTDTELHVTNSLIDAYSTAAATAANKGNYENYYQFMNKAAHYGKRKTYLQNLKDKGLCEGNSCIYTSTDNYGKQYKVASNVEFAKHPNKYGFVKIDTADRKVGDLQQRVVDYNNHPYHMMMLNGVDENGIARFNYSAGGNDESSIRVNAKYPLEEGEHIDTYRFVGTSADSVRWTNEYNKLYMNNSNKKRLGGRTKAEWGMEEGGLADTLTDIIPIIGSAKDITRLIRNPSWKQAGRTLFSVGTDILGYKTLAGVAKLAKASKAGKIINKIDDVVYNITPNINNKFTKFLDDNYDVINKSLTETGVSAIGELIQQNNDMKNKENSNKKQLGGSTGLIRVQANGKDRLMYVPFTGEETKAGRKKALFGVKLETPKLSYDFSRADKIMESIKNNNENENWGKKDWMAPTISALGNGLASLLSYKINKNMLGDIKYTDMPVPKRANHLITRVNVEPKLTNLRENLARSIESTIANTSDSRVSQSRINDMALNTTLAMNAIYADKENQERDLINKSRINQQEVANANIDAYNTWRTGKTNFENTIREQQSENAVSLVDNINKGIQTGITDAEKRRQFRNNLAIMAAAYPNVTPELLRTYGVDFLRMGGKVKLNKKK